MLNNEGKRMLAYVQTVSAVEPIAGADAIEKATVLGWSLIVKKGEFKPGDKCAFFEIDSKVPATETFAFLAKKNYAVRTYKLNKFGVLGEGLIMPLKDVGVEEDTPVGTDLTERLGVTYAVAEDNVRKTDPVEAAQKTFMAKHKKFFNRKWVKRLMKYKFFRNLFLSFMNKKEAQAALARAFPTDYVSKTDEERIQNMPEVLEDHATRYVATEKIDGTSTTWLLVRNKRKFKFYVCSRNTQVFTADETKVLDDDCVYWENAKKYNVREQLEKYLKAHPEMEWVCIQGESYGEGLQGNPLKLKGHHFAAFNFKNSVNGRLGSEEGKALLESWETPIPWVPIVDANFAVPAGETVDNMLDYATANSAVNPKVLREGIVFRTKDGKFSFKAVSPTYLMKRHL